jgi:hypothetical protein
MSVVVENWPSIRAELADIDLDTYRGYDKVAAFAPKSRLNVRRVSLLHPYDLIFLTALVLEVRDGSPHRGYLPMRIACFPIAPSKSGRTNCTPKLRDISDFRDAVEKRVQEGRSNFVGITDIGDFYPRIYQHRLVNALQAANDSSRYEYIRVLEKMLDRLAGASYGIPVGPAASRVLGEAVLIDVDSTLLSSGIDFIRFTDDFVVFSDTPVDAEYGIRILGETLFSTTGSHSRLRRRKFFPPPNTWRHTCNLTTTKRPVGANSLKSWADTTARYRMMSFQSIKGRRSTHSICQRC